MAGIKNSNLFSAAIGLDIGERTPTALAEFAAGTAVAGTAPIKLTAGTLLTTPEGGAIEYNGSDLFFTDDMGVRHPLGSSSGSVTSVAMTVPTGLSVAGSPVTTAGTLAVSLTAGYVIPTQSLLDTFVVGPASATDNHLAVFDGTSGKLIKDGGAIPSGGATTGQLAYFADADSAPSGWLKCDGSVVSQVTYPDLFTQVGLINGPNNLWSYLENSNVGNSSSAAIGYGNGVYLYLPAASSQIFTSTDVQTWTERKFPTSVSAPVPDYIIYGGGVYLASAGSSGGNLYTSTDSITWTQQTVDSNTAGVRSFGYGNNLYILTTAKVPNPVYTSTDAVTWTSVSYQLPVTAGQIVHDGTRFVIGGTSRCYTTTDAVTWNTSKPAISSGTQGFSTSVIFANSIYVCCGPNGQVHTSTDSITWVIRDSKTTSSIDALTFGSSLFILGSDGGGIATSTDAVTWTARTSGTGSNILSVGNSSLSNKFIAAGGGGNLRTSTDGITWDSRTSGTSSSINTVTFGTVYVYGTIGGGMATSTDGVTWDSQTSGTTSAIRCLTYDGSVYLYGADGGVISTSTDAVTWSAQTTGIGATINCITFANSIYLAGCAGGQILSSTDAVTWSSRWSGNFQNSVVNSITWDGTKFFAGGSSGEGMSTSTDGVSWTPYSPYNIVQNVIANGNGVFVGVGSSGGIQTSTDGLIWTVRNSNTITSFNQLGFGGGKFIAAGIGTLISSTDGITWDPKNVPAPIRFGSTALISNAQFTNQASLPLVYGDRFFTLASGLGIRSGTVSTIIIYTNTDYSYDTDTQFQLPSDSYSNIAKEYPDNFKRSLYIKS